MKKTVIGACILGVIVLLIRFYIKHSNQDLKYAEVQMKAFQTALEKYRKDCGSYPVSRNGLNALVQKPSEVICPNYKDGGYLFGADMIPNDPADNPFIYSSDGVHYSIKSKSGIEVSTPN